jgi:hypothetical protein
MAHFAKLGANGKVIQVLTMDNDRETTLVIIQKRLEEIMQV